MYNVATTKARDEKAIENDPAKAVKLGAGGGFAPEGYRAPETVGTHPLVEGVTERGAKGDHERFVEAEKFQQSKVEFAKKVKEGKAGDVVKDQLKEQEKEAAKKPTAAGAATELDNPAVAQSAEATKKAEEKVVEDAKSTDVKKTEPKEKK